MPPFIDTHPAAQIFCALFLALSLLIAVLGPFAAQTSLDSRARCPREHTFSRRHYLREAISFYFFAIIFGVIAVLLTGYVTAG